jgi:CO dehydrogenase nickel-insertion accessory protein CooC1
MIINTQSIVLTLFVVILGCYGGLHFIRQFALQIAKENHDAILQMDAEENIKLHRKLGNEADRATIDAYAKVVQQQQQLTGTPITTTTTTGATNSTNSNSVV